MRKYLLLLLIPFLLGSAPSRSHTYTSGEIINSSHVTANEDSLFNYLQAGVSVYEDGSIDNDAVANGANIQCSKINLTACSQNVGITGTLAVSSYATATGLIATTALQPAAYGADPCASLTPGVIFYNSLDGVMCFCNNSGTDLRTDNESACF